MRGLAAFVMRGRWQAVLVTTVMAILALRLPPLSMLSGAALGLVVLRQGPREALLVMTGSVFMTGLLGLWLTGSIAPAISFVVMLWLPMLMMGIVLRRTVSLAWALQSAAILVIVVLAVIYALAGDLTPWWREMLETMQPLFAEAKIAAEGPELDAVFDEAAKLMTGMTAAVLGMSLMLNLLLARWWQARLYNPGGFREEFHALRLPRESAIAVIVIAAATALLPGVAGEFFRDVGLIVMTVYLFAGLALAHAIIARRRMKSGWLIGLYGLIVIAMPQTTLALVMVGLTDSWMNLRGRVKDAPDT